MANPTITNIDNGGVVLGDPIYKDETLYLSGADSIAAGTILSRRKVATAVTVAATQGNTGTGTVTLATVVAGAFVPLVGAYVLTCIAAVSNGGIFKLADPNGNVVNPYIPMGTASTGSVIIKTAGLQFTITDATDFVAGDSFTLTVAADNKLALYAPTEVGGAQTPCAVLTYPVVTTGAASVPIRALIGGKVKSADLIIDDGTTVAVAHLEALREVGIQCESSVELAQYDNYT